MNQGQMLNDIIKKLEEIPSEREKLKQDKIQNIEYLTKIKDLEKQKNLFKYFNNLDFSTGEVFDSSGKFFQVKGTPVIKQEGLCFKRFTNTFTINDEGFIKIEESAYNGSVYEHFGFVTDARKGVSGTITINSSEAFSGIISFLFEIIGSIDDTNCNPDYFKLLINGKEVRLSLDSAPKVCLNKSGFNIEIKETLIQKNATEIADDYHYEKVGKVFITGNFPKTTTIQYFGISNEGQNNESFAFVKYSTKLENVSNFNNLLKVGYFGNWGVALENENVETKFKFSFKLNNNKDAEILKGILSLKNKDLFIGEEKLITPEIGKWYELVLKNTAEKTFDVLLNFQKILSVKNLETQNLEILPNWDGAVKELKIYKDTNYDN